jgi:hypothetical protein
MFYSTLNLITNEVAVHSSKKEATDWAVNENKKSNDHPSFYLYSQESGASTSKFEGELYRKFGSDEFEWCIR